MSCHILDCWDYAILHDPGCKGDDTGPDCDWLNVDNVFTGHRNAPYSRSLVIILSSRLKFIVLLMFPVHIDFSSAPVLSCVCLP